jgi:hypothetical protein
MDNIAADLSLNSYPGADYTIPPTSGKQDRKSANLSAADQDKLKSLLDQTNKAYATWQSWIPTYQFSIKETTRLMSGNTTLQNAQAQAENDIQVAKLDKAITVATRLNSEMQKICDPNDLYSVNVEFGDYSDIYPYNSHFKEYLETIKAIQPQVANIKNSAQPVAKETTIAAATDNGNPNAPDITVATVKSVTIPIHPFEKIMYQISMNMIMPGATDIQIDQYIQDMLYSIDFDKHAMPILSVGMRVPYAVIASIKDHFENITWRWSVSKIAKISDKKEVQDFAIPEVIFDNVELTAIDPDFNAVNLNKDTASRPEGAIPTYPLKIDFIMKKDNLASSHQMARIFNNVRMMDILTFLCNALKKDNPDLSFTITPPDNQKVYEQVIMEPSTFTQAINNLQDRYGLYRSGVRVSLSSNTQVSANPDTQVANSTSDVPEKKVTKSYVTITDKTGTAPATGAFSNVLIEIVDTRNTDNLGYESGSWLDKDSKTLVVRSSKPYSINKNNSERLSNGENMRVLHNSSNFHARSVCDAVTNVVGSQRLYKHPYDNEYALSQVQTAVHEKTLQVGIEVADIDIFTFSDNLNYYLKFYSADDTTASGTYRITNAQFLLRDGNSGPKNAIETSGKFIFTDIPPLKQDGKVIERPTYEARVNTAIKETTTNANSTGTVPMPTTAVGLFGIPVAPAGNSVSKAIDSAKSGISGALATAKAATTAVNNTITSAVKNVENAVSDTVNSGLDQVNSGVNTVKASVGSTYDSALSNIKTSVSPITESASKALGDGKDVIVKGMGEAGFNVPSTVPTSNFPVPAVLGGVAAAAGVTTMMKLRALVQPNKVAATSTIAASTKVYQFRPTFTNRKDYNNNVVPDTIADNYNMSVHVQFKDVYDCVTGTDINAANAMMQNFPSFIYAQKFSNEILDPIIEKFGKFNYSNGKLLRFYKYSVPALDGLASQSLVALSADFVPTSDIGDSLCSALLWIAINSGLDFDQLILEGDGNQWKFIHIGRQLNGTNRKQVLLMPNTSANTNFYQIDPTVIGHESQIYYKNYKSLIN